EAVVDEDVAGIAAARIDVAEGSDPMRSGGRERKHDRAYHPEENPHDCLDVQTGGLIAADGFNTAMAAGYVGILSVELHFPEAGSLKGERKYVKSAKAQLQPRSGASVAEVDHHELWQRSRLTLSCVAREYREAERLLDEAERYLAGQELGLGQADRD